MGKKRKKGSLYNFYVLPNKLQTEWLKATQMHHFKIL